AFRFQVRQYCTTSCALTSRSREHWTPSRPSDQCSRDGAAHWRDPGTSGCRHLLDAAHADSIGTATRVYSQPSCRARVCGGVRKTEQALVTEFVSACASRWPLAVGLRRHFPASWRDLDPP